MPDTPRQPDILYRLRFYADHVDDVPVRDLEAIMREAAEDIKILRDLVGIKNDILLEDMPPEGNA
ncbi:hypothetical protein [Devosia sp. SL43]|uniref:hypothetical protein n=1 Tax=Devosia sp. SL43 TaxID=2806348 RepID=UPI001F3B1AAF|nr:hypothetical protein [Devosia sp. SL43]UJW87923.1 hypothetical protein IM737_20795 [Devosia sp. SL43]